MAAEAGAGRPYSTRTPVKITIVPETGMLRSVEDFLRPGPPLTNGKIVAIRFAFVSPSRLIWPHSG